MSAESLEENTNADQKRERVLRLFVADRERSCQGSPTAFDKLLEVSAHPFIRPAYELYSAEVEPLVIQTGVSLDGVVYLSAVCGGAQRRVSADLHEGGTYQELASPASGEVLIPLDVFFRTLDTDE
jgi:hypothetical protein